MISDIIYSLRFRFYLWRNVPGMRLSDDLKYPTDGTSYRDDRDPIEDARTEMSYMES